MMNIQTVQKPAINIPVPTESDIITVSGPHPQIK